jgi:hypothetical protein
VVTSDEAVKALHDLAEYTGYCWYMHIDKIGVWKFDEDEEGFVM